MFVKTQTETFVRPTWFFRLLVSSPVVSLGFRSSNTQSDAETSGESHLEANVEFLWLYLQTGPWEIDVASFLFLFFKTISLDDGDD